MMRGCVQVFFGFFSFYINWQLAGVRCFLICWLSIRVVLECSRRNEGCAIDGFFGAPGSFFSWSIWGDYLIFYQHLTTQLQCMRLFNAQSLHVAAMQLHEYGGKRNIRLRDLTSNILGAPRALNS